MLSHDGLGFSAQMLSATTSTSVGTRVLLDRPVEYFGLQVVAASCNASISILGSVATSSDATLTTLLSWASSSGGGGSTSGTSVWSTTPQPVRQIAAQLTAGASSGGASAWVSAV